LPPGVATLLGQANLALVPPSTQHIRRIKAGDSSFQEDAMDVDDNERKPQKAPQGTNHEAPTLEMKRIDLQHEEKKMALIHKLSADKRASQPSASGRSLRSVGLGTPQIAPPLLYLMCVLMF
jgi:hypothetical protein